MPSRSALPAFLVCLTLALTSCTSTGGTRTSVASTPAVDLAQLPGYSGPGGEGIYTCISACTPLEFVSYSTLNSSARSVDGLRGPIGQALLRAIFASQRTRSGTRLQIDGAAQSVTAGGRTAALYNIKSVKKDGSPGDPGVMVLLPNGGRVLHIFGISKSRGIARRSALKFIEALKL